MASRMFQEKINNLEIGLVKLYCVFSVGAVGAATLNTALSKGITSVTRSAAGTYDIVLDDAYNAFLHLSGMLLDSAGEDITFQVEVADVANKSINIFTNTAGTPTDPASGDVMYLEITLKNSSV